jgi:hypothetical protein
MGLGLKRTYGTGQIPVFQGSGKDIQLAQGGFVLDRTGLADGDVLVAATPFSFDEIARTAKPFITSVIFANAGATDVVYQVKKGSLLKVGNYLALVAGGKSYAITAIDTSNAAYDSVTVGTTLGAATANDLAFVSAATGATAAAIPFTTKNGGLLYRETIVSDGHSVSIVIRGTVYARRAPYSVALENVLTKIIYSQSK